MVSYIISLLRGTPLLAIRPLLEATPRQAMFDDHTLFVQYLRLNYEDPDERGTARRKLDSLRQIGSASSYFAEFQRMAGSRTRCDKAIKGLKPYLKDELARLGERPVSLTNPFNSVTLCSFCDTQHLRREAY